MKCLSFNAKPQNDFKFNARPADWEGAIVAAYNDVVATFEGVAVCYEQIYAYTHLSLETGSMCNFNFKAEPRTRLSFIAEPTNDFVFDIKLVCNVPTYLEIRPEMIWVYEDWSAQNDVLSNTNWNIN